MGVPGKILLVGFIFTIVMVMIFITPSILFMFFTGRWTKKMEKNKESAEKQIKIEKLFILGKECLLILQLTK